MLSNAWPFSDSRVYLPPFMGLLAAMRGCIAHSRTGASLRGTPGARRADLVLLRAVLGLVPADSPPAAGGAAGGASG